MWMLEMWRLLSSLLHHPVCVSEGPHTFALKARIEEEPTRVAQRSPPHLRRRRPNSARCGPEVDHLRGDTTRIWPRVRRISHGRRPCFGPTSFTPWRFRRIRHATCSMFGHPGRWNGDAPGTASWLAQQGRLRGVRERAVCGPSCRVTSVRAMANDGSHAPALGTRSSPWPRRCRRLSHPINAQGGAPLVVACAEASRQCGYRDDRLYGWFPGWRFATSLCLDAVV